MPEIGGSKIHPISAPNHPLSTSSFISKSDLSIFRFFPQEGPCFWLRLPRRGDKKGILPFSSCPSFFFSLQRPFKNGPALSFVLGSPRSLGKMLELDHSSLSFPPSAPALTIKIYKNVYFYIFYNVFTIYIYINIYIYI